MRAEDARQVRIVQELFTEDGDLGEDGLPRLPRLYWNFDGMSAFCLIAVHVRVHI